MEQLVREEEESVAASGVAPHRGIEQDEASPGIGLELGLGQHALQLGQVVAVRPVQGAQHVEVGVVAPPAAHQGELPGGLREGRVPLERATVVHFGGGPGVAPKRLLSFPELVVGADVRAGPPGDVAERLELLRKHPPHDGVGRSTAPAQDVGRRPRHREQVRQPAGRIADGDLEEGPGRPRDHLAVHAQPGPERARRERLAPSGRRHVPPGEARRDRPRRPRRKPFQPASHVMRQPAPDLTVFTGEGDHGDVGEGGPGPGGPGRPRGDGPEHAPAQHRRRNHRRQTPPAGVRPQGRAELGRVGPALLRRQREAPSQRPGEPPRHSGPVGAGGLGRQDPAASGTRLVEDRGGGVEVRPRRDSAAHQLLRRHVRAGPDPLARLGQGRFGAQREGDPEVAEQHPVAVQKDVPGLHVPVHHALPMGGLERVEQAPAQLRHRARGKGAALEPPRQRLPLHVIHHVVEKPVGRPRLVDRQDVRVVEPREEAGFAVKPLDGPGRGEFRPQDLDRDGTAEPAVPAQEDDPHPAGPQLALEVVLAREGISNTL